MIHVQLIGEFCARLHDHSVARVNYNSEISRLTLSSYRDSVVVPKRRAFMRIFVYVCDYTNTLESKKSDWKVRGESGYAEWKFSYEISIDTPAI